MTSPPHSAVRHRTQRAAVAVAVAWGKQADVWGKRKSLQLLTHHLRALLRALLPLPPQPARPHPRHHALPLLQVPILPLRRPHHLHPLPHLLLLLLLPPLLKHRKQGGQEHHRHEPVRRHVAVLHDRREHGPRHLLQVRHRAHPAHCLRGEGRVVGAVREVG